MSTNKLVSRVATSGVAVVDERPDPTRTALNDLLKSALRRRLGGTLGGLEKAIARIENAARPRGK